MKGKKHYSGKELIYRRQLARQQAEKEANHGNNLTKTLRRVNTLRSAVERTKQRMREDKNNENGSI